MALSKDDILNAIAEMSVIEVVELVEAMEEKFGVSAAAAVAVAAPAAGGDAAAAEEQTEFDVVLTAAVSKKFKNRQIRYSTYNSGISYTTEKGRQYILPADSGLA